METRLRAAGGAISRVMSAGSVVPWWEAPNRSVPRISLPSWQGHGKGPRGSATACATWVRQALADAP